MSNHRKKNEKQTMKNAAEMLAVDSDILFQERHKMEQAKHNLEQLHHLMDDSISDQKEFLNMLENNLEHPNNSNHSLLKDSLHKVENREIPNIEFITLIEEMELSYNWEEAVLLNQQYAETHGIDIENPFLSMFTDVERLEVSKQMVEKLELLKLDKMDYAFAASAGIIAGVIDAMFVGVIKKGTEATGLQDKVDKAFAKIVNKYGKHERIAELKKQRKSAATADSKKNLDEKIKNVQQGIVKFSKDGEKRTREWTSKDGIKWLEKYHRTSYDTAVNKKDANFNIAGMTADNHHLLSLAHEPSLLGLLIGIIDQISGKSTFIDVLGNINRVKTDNVNKELSGNIIQQISQACENWFGHIMSDISGSSTSKGRGSGLPVPGWAILQKMQFGSFTYNDNHTDVTVAEVSNLMFKNGYDLRAFTAQLIPVIIYETLLRCYWFYKQYYYFGKDLKESVPIATNRELARLLLIAASSFSAVDVGHAVVKSVPGSPKFLADFLMTVNIPGLLDLGFRSFQNIRNEVLHRKHVEHIYEKDILQEYNRVINDSSIL